MVTMPAVPTFGTMTTIALFISLSSFFAFAARATVSASAAVALAHCLARFLALFVAKFSVSVFIELLEHALSHLFATGSILRFAALVRRLGERRQRQQPGQRDRAKKNVSHGLHLGSQL